MARRFGTMLAALGFVLALAVAGLWFANQPPAPNLNIAPGDWLGHAVAQGRAKQRDTYAQCLYSQTYGAPMAPRELCPAAGNLYLITAGGIAVLILGLLISAAARPQTP
ncbi:hypothetical protein [Hyphomicrobium sp. CS1BSMeth3]|uniref:hypothetical protein n=1 Tax=Hyphomicrobium sp. CS1BSMeth3 TaxID=1892844 RepID=UPI000931DDF9|nr:hypothetical protein [Hyphomicrobium sp. CS1BSMeth3]